MTATPPDLDALRGPLASWLASQLRATSPSPVRDTVVETLTPPGAGQSNETLLFTAHWSDGTGEQSGDFVLRRQPTSHRLFLDADVIREFRVLAALETGSRVPVPAMLWSESTAAPLGGPFFVMSQVPGTVPTGRPSIHRAGWLPTLTPAERTRLWSSALDVVVAVHDVDWQRTHAFLAEGPWRAPGLSNHLQRLDAWYQWSTQGRSFPITDAAVEELKKRAPAIKERPPVLVWGDARIGNMIFNDDLTVAAAIDWELASLGPPEADLGHWLFFDRFFTEGAHVEALDGLPDRATTIARYQERTGRVLVDLDYFELMAEVMVATTLIRQADLRVEAGVLEPGTRMGHDNSVTQMIARRLGLPVPEQAPDYVAHRTPRPSPGSAAQP